MKLLQEVTRISIVEFTLTRVRVFTLSVIQKSPDGTIREGTLNLVDLAGVIFALFHLINKLGSEQVAKTGATGATLEEVSGGT